MKLCPVVLAVVLLGVSGWAVAQALDPLQVRSMAAACASCHGTHGVTQSGHLSVAGLSQQELLQKLLDFKAGTKPATLMHQIVRGYSDEQLGAMAAYFSVQKR